MKIKRFNESAELTTYDKFQNHIPQTILSKDEISDYFSLMEPYCSVEVELSIINSNNENDDGIYISKFETNYCYDGEIVYIIELYPKNIDRQYYIDHGDSSEDLSNMSDFLVFTKIVNELNSINKKIESHNHSILFTNDGFLIKCIVRNNDNKKISNI